MWAADVGPTCLKAAEPEAPRGPPGGDLAGSTVAHSLTRMTAGQTATGERGAGTSSKTSAGRTRGAIRELSSSRTHDTTSGVPGHPAAGFLIRNRHAAPLAKRVNRMCYRCFGTGRTRGDRRRAGTRSTVPGERQGTPDSGRRRARLSPVTPKQGSTREVGTNASSPSSYVVHRRTTGRS
jgi:hypothetical protein